MITWLQIPFAHNYELGLDYNNKQVFIKRVKDQKILEPKLSNKGYLFLNLYENDKKNHLRTIHRIVALTCIPNPDNLPIINHKDENPLNNWVDNLEWCTYEYNNTYNDIHKRNREKIKQKYSSTVYVCNLDGDLILEAFGTREGFAQLQMLDNNVTSLGAFCTVLVKNKKQFPKLFTTKGYIPSYKKLSKEEIEQGLSKYIRTVYNK